VTTAEDYATIADTVYAVDALWPGGPTPKEGYKFPPENPRFEVVHDPVSDPVTG
jgi:hypothetical protein